MYLNDILVKINPTIYLTCNDKKSQRGIVGLCPAVIMMIDDDDDKIK